jgi:hypothetical protein
MLVPSKYEVKRLVYGDGRISYRLIATGMDISPRGIYPSTKVILERPCLHMITHEVKIIKRKDLAEKVLSTTVLETF